MKKYILVGANENTAKLLSVIPPDDVEFILDRNHGGLELAGKKIYGSMNGADLPQIREMFEFVLVSFGESDIKFMHDHDLPFIFYPALLMRYGVKDLDMYPYPIKYILNTYGKEEILPLSDEEIKKFSEWEEKYDKLLIGVIHPTAIGNFCFTYGRFCEYAYMRKSERVFVGICKGWHPLMDTVKNYEVPNTYLYKKMLDEYSNISEHNANFIANYICYHPHKIEVFDYNSAVQLADHAYKLTLADKYLAPAKFPPKSRITFTVEEQKKGFELEKKMGIWNPYVCFFARENAYVQTTHRNIPNSTFVAATELRNTDINDFSFMAKKLQEHGIQSVRMGSIVEKKYTGVGVDYSNIGQSEFMDLYLFAHCSFCVLYDSGIFHIPFSLFSKPSIFIEPPYVVAYHGDSFGIPDLVIFALTYSDDKKRLLTLREILEIMKSLDFYVYNYYQYWVEHNLHTVPASPEDLWDVSEEMMNILNGTQQYTDEDNELQAKFRFIVDEYVGNDKRIGGSLSRIGAKWLKKNKWYLE